MHKNIFYAYKAGAIGIHKDAPPNKFYHEKNELWIPRALKIHNRTICNISLCKIFIYGLGFILSNCSLLEKNYILSHCLKKYQFLGQLLLNIYFRIDLFMAMSQNIHDNFQRYLFFIHKMRYSLEKKIWVKTNLCVVEK